MFPCPIWSASASPGPIHHEELGIVTSGLELDTLGEFLLLDTQLVGWQDEQLLVGVGFGNGWPQSWFLYCPWLAQSLNEVFC
jgi:hypothetical protein